MDYLSLNLLTITLTVPLYSMVDPAFNKSTLSATLNSCITLPIDNSEADESCYDHTKVFKKNESNEQFIKSFVNNIKQK